MTRSKTLLDLENETNLRKLIDVVRGSKLATFWFLHKHGLAGDQPEPGHTDAASLPSGAEQAPAA